MTTTESRVESVMGNGGQTLRLRIHVDLLMDSWHCQKSGGARHIGLKDNVILLDKTSSSPAL
jgi:hypothetical protein